MKAALPIATSHGRHSVWWLQGEHFADPLGRYAGGLVFTWAAIPEAMRATHTALLTFCTGDASDPPSQYPGFHQDWDRLIAENNWWLRDPAEKRVAGWGGPESHRYATDLTKVGFANATKALIRRFMEQNGDWCAGFHHDDLTMRPFWPVEGIDMEAWARCCLNISRYECDAPWRCSLNAGKLWYHTPEQMDCFDTWKFEGFRPYFCKRIPDGGDYFWGAGWRGPKDNPFKWRDWFEGRPRVLSGYLPSSRVKTVVLEAIYEYGWPAYEKANYYRIANGTVLLGDGMLMAHHRGIPGHEDWSRHPYWDSSFEWVRLLGEPKEQAHCDNYRLLWTRRFERGTLLVNATTNPAYMGKVDVPAHDARISLAV